MWRTVFSTMATSIFPAPATRGSGSRPRSAARMDAGHPLISLGGDHAIAWPVLRAVRRRHPRLTIVQIDAHPDIYDAYQGNKRSHTSSFARILEEGLADRLIQIGLRTLNDELRDQLARFGVEVIEARHFSEDLRLDLKTPVYLSVDLDGLDPACAPGVSHREPGGLTTRQVIGLIQGIDQPIVGGRCRRIQCEPGRLQPDGAGRRQAGQGNRRHDDQDAWRRLESIWQGGMPDDCSVKHFQRKPPCRIH